MENFKNDFNIKITKRSLLLFVNNSMCTNWVYLVNGRIYNENKTRFRRFKMIIWFDGEDFGEFAENDDTLEPIDYLDELIASYTIAVNGYNDCKNFYEMCNESIEYYNSHFCR